MRYFKIGMIFFFHRNYGFTLIHWAYSCDGDDVTIDAVHLIHNSIQLVSDLSGNFSLIHKNEVEQL